MAVAGYPVCSFVAAALSAGMVGGWGASGSGPGYSHCHGYHGYSWKESGSSG